MYRVSCFLVFCIFFSQSAFAQTVSNGVSGDGRYEIEVDDGGGSRTGSIDPIGASSFQDVIFDYFHYIQMGSSVFRLRDTTITTPAFSSGTNQVTSAGTFREPNGLVEWTAQSFIQPGEDLYFVKLIFRSNAPLGNMRLIQYLDEDVAAVSDDQLVVSSTSGQRDFQLLTVDNSEGVGVAQGAIYNESIGMGYAGWTADEYSDLKHSIESGSASFSITGVVDTADLPPFSDPRFPGLPAYGLADVTSAIAFDFDPNATFGSVTLYLGGSPDGRVLDIAPPERLRSPAHTKFNTYLGQFNFLELVSGETGRQQQVIGPKSQFHFNGSAMLEGDTLGSVEV